MRLFRRILMDFVKIDVIVDHKKETITAMPNFLPIGQRDLLIRKDQLYGYWDGTKWHGGNDSDVEESMLLSIDRLTWQKAEEEKKKYPEYKLSVKQLGNYNDGLFSKYRKFSKEIKQTNIILDRKIRFRGENLKREDYATFTLDYAPEEGPSPVFDQMINTWYNPSDVNKIMWAIGCILSGDTANVQKFLYLYGAKGEGKGSVIKILELLCGPYIGNISLATLTSGDPFATAGVKDVPVLIDSDADMSRIRNDTELLKLVSHETFSVNAKYIQPYDLEFNGMLIAASNSPYKVRDQNSGITRRALVARPSGRLIPINEYQLLFDRIKFEIPQVAYACIQKYKEMGRNYYEGYEDKQISEETDLMYAFMVENYTMFASKPRIAFKTVKLLYLDYLEDMQLNTIGAGKKLKDQMKKIYWTKHYRDTYIGEERYRDVFEGFKTELFEVSDILGQTQTKVPDWLLMDQTKSRFDAMAAKWPAQPANKEGLLNTPWDDCKGILEQLDTSELHWVRVPLNHIVIDFDLKNTEGEKDLAFNLDAASKFPPTYSEVSKSGQGVHLHYIWDGEPEALAADYAEGIEVKVYKGKSSLRRKLTKCNDLEVAHISSGLPLKEEQQMIQEYTDIVWNDQKLRKVIEGNLRKEYHSATKPSIDFMNKVLTEAKAEGIQYNLLDLKPAVLIFAQKSSHNSKYCMQVALKMPFTSEESEGKRFEPQADEFVKDEGPIIIPDDELVFYDIEIFPNLFVVCTKTKVEKEKGLPGRSYINPEPEEMVKLMDQPLVGFNNRNYDNHLIYDAAMGKPIISLFKQSQDIINGPKNKNPGKRPAGYGLGYADVLDYATKKQGLKKWEIELGLPHDELELDWDKPVPEELWERVAEYCMNDVDATIDVFDHTRQDYEARLILAQLSGLPVIASTNMHSAAFLFGNDPKPEEKFIYTDLAQDFPGYKYEFGKSEYRGEDPGEGGYVYAEPGVYKNAAILDVASMHPHSAVALDYFGPYTQQYKDLIQARLYVKHRDFEAAGKMFNGVLKPYLKEETADALAYALKIVINIVYGMSSAKFPNKFKHPKNIDNIIAKRGALFMIDLKHEVQDRGFTVVHIKTDSIKIAEATDEIIQFCMDYAKKWGYEFEHEATFEKVALVNRSVLVGKHSYPDEEWEVVGKMFAEPYTYKTLVSHEDVADKDFAVVKTTKVPMYLDTEYIGKAGEFYASRTGKPLIKKVVKKGEEKMDAVTGTKGYLWREFTDFQGAADVDVDYYEAEVIKAIQAIEKVGPIFEIFPNLPERYTELLPF